MAERVEIPEGFTPGPWHVDPEAGPENFNGDKADTGVWAQARFDAALDDFAPMDEAWVCGIWGGALTATDHANARLIALAPDMAAELTALREREAVLVARLTDCLDWMEAARTCGDCGFWDWTEGDIYTSGRRAITSEGQE